MKVWSSRILRECTHIDHSLTHYQQVQHDDNDGVVFRSQDGAEEMRAYLLIRGKAVRDRVDDMWNIVHEVLSDVKLEDKRDRVLEMLHESRAGMESTLISSGHSVGASYLSSQRTVSGKFSDLGNGLGYLESLPTLIDRVENDWDSVLNDLHRLHQNVIKSNDLTVGLTSESCDLDSARQCLTRFVRSLPTSDTKTSTTSRAEAWRSVRSLYHSLMENHSIRSLYHSLMENHSNTSILGT